MFNLLQNSLFRNFGSQSNKKDGQSFGGQTGFGQEQKQSDFGGMDMFGKQDNQKPQQGSGDSKPTEPIQPIIPEGDTVDQRLRSMMENPLYKDPNDKRLYDHVTNEFKRAYPGNAEYDEFGKMMRPKPSIQPNQVRAFDPNGLMSKPKAMGMQKPTLPDAAQIGLKANSPASAADAIAKLDKPFIPPSRAQHIDQEIGFGTGNGDFVTGPGAHDEDVDDIIANTKVPQGMQDQFAEQRQIMEAQQQQDRMQRYEDIAEEGYDMSDDHLEASGVETMDDMTANAMTRDEYHRHQAAQRMYDAQQQARTGQEAEEYAEDMHDQTIQDMSDAHEKGSPLSQDQLQQKAEDAAFAQTVRNGIGGTDFTHKRNTMNNMSDWKKNDPKAYEKAGPEARHLHGVYEEYKAEALKQGLTPEEAERIAMEKTDNYGAAMYSPLIAVDEIRGATNEMLTGAGMLSGNGINTERYNNAMKATLQPGFAQSERGQSIKSGAKIATNIAIGALPMGAGAVVSGLRAGAGGAHQVAQAGGDVAAQRAAALARGGAGAATSLFMGKAMKNVGASKVRKGVKPQWKEKIGKGTINETTSNMTDQAAATGIDAIWSKKDSPKGRNKKSKAKNRSN